ncbi:MAG: helicase C-terminal domain-containing protein [Thermoflexales bacterium]
MQTLVCLDIETTGSDPQQDAILEVAVVVFRGREVVDEWESVVRVDRPVPPRICQLTGITDEEVQRKGRPLADCLSELEKTIGTLVIVGHNIAFDMSFFAKLPHQPAFVNNPTLDTFELASVLLPHAGRYSLEMLVQHLQLPTTGRAHRALNDARATYQLYCALFERAQALPEETVEQIAKLYERQPWQMGLFWREVRKAQQRGTFNTSLGAALSSALRPGRDGKNSLQRRFVQSQLAGEPLQPNQTLSLLNGEQLVALLGPDGPFAQRVDGYEIREQQIDMMRRVSEAFNSQQDMVLIEAGTGTGKSMAYLVPSLVWSSQNNARVVVSTNTVNLQEQLIQKDVPLVQRVLGLDDVRVVVMKGKGHYLCHLRLTQALREGPRNAEEARVLSKILIWLPSTLEGDGDELFLPTPAERDVFHHLSADSPSCNANTCSAANCFFYQARQRAERAHVVIVNHALLLADVAVDNRALPEYQYLVVDEAHHLESATTSALRWRIGLGDIERELSDLGLRSNDAGLLPEIAAQARRSLHGNQSNAIEERCKSALGSATDLGQHASEAFRALEQFARQHATDEQSDYAQRLRLIDDLRQQPDWVKVETAAENFLRACNALVNDLRNLSQFITNNVALTVQGDFEGALARLNGAVKFFTDLSERLHHLFFNPSRRHIYWAEFHAAGRSKAKQPPLSLTLNIAPLEVGSMLREHLWNKKSVVVLTSATLRTTTADEQGCSAQPSFHFIKQRLGAEEANELAIDSPFDYKANALLYLVSDMPEPTQPHYQQCLNAGLIELFTASQGRGLALFTSYSQLRASARAIGPALDQEGIVMLEQTSTNSRSALIDNFRKQRRAVLLGTRSFWEGVDIQGEQLSVVAICKLPFDVPNDPIFAARSETFDNPFGDYLLPEAVLRFRQGFGRLIRSKRDRGLVVVFDSRVLNKPYGQAFLQALPPVTVRRAPLAMLGRAVQAWLQRSPVCEADMCGGDN